MNGLKERQAEREDKDLLRDLQEGEEKVAVLLYTQHRQEFLKWAQAHYQLNVDHGADVFQEAVISLFLQARQGRLRELHCSVKTYLFAIGKNLALKHLRRQKRVQEELSYASTVQDEPLEIEEEPPQQLEQLVMQALETMGEPCKSILRLFYFKGSSMAEVAQALGYKNENVVKSQKLRCMNELKTKVKECLKKG